MDDILAQVLRGMEIGEPVSHGLLHIYPLRGDTREENDIWLLGDALWAGTLRIEEGLHGAGSEPELRVVNEGALRVLVLEGDELIGAGQNRVVNSSVLVDAASEVVLPVSCAARGRWSSRSQAFSSGRGSPDLTLRRPTSRSVHESLTRGRGHRDDRRGAWREIDRRARLHGACSPTHTLHDSRTYPSERLDAFGKLARELPEGTSGVVVAVGERLALLEVLAGPNTFARVFRRLLSCYALESVGLDRPYGTPDIPAVEGFIEAVAEATHQEHRAVGAGRDVRLEGKGVSGYALVGDKGVLHAAFAG